jgi:hypothetical protein
MGDRANFGFRDSKENIVFLYGHWAGYRMLENLADAVSAAEPRWSDNEHKVPIIDWKNKTFTLMEEDLETVVFSTSLNAFVSKYCSQPSMV